MSTSRGVGRRRRGERESETVHVEDKTEDAPTPRRGRKPAQPISESDIVPKGKRRKVEKEPKTEPEDFDNDVNRSRPRLVSATEDSSDSVQRSSRQRQPSRRMMESKESEVMVKEQLAQPKKRLSSLRQEEADQMSVETEEVPFESEEITVEEKPKKPIRKKNERTEEVAPMVQPELEQPTESSKVVFKTVTQQPELPKEVGMLGAQKKAFAAGPSTAMVTKPIFPMRSGTIKPVIGSPIVVAPRTPTVRYVEKSMAASSSKFMPGPSNQLEKRTVTTAIPRPLRTEPKITESDLGGSYQEADISNEETYTIEGKSENRMVEKIKSDLPEEDDEAPPQLQAEKPTHEDFNRAQPVYMDNENVVRCQSPGGTAQYVTVARGEDGTEVYLDENGEEVQMMEDVQDDLRTVEFNFLDSKNICCGLCGEIVPYDSLMSHHLPQHHPEVLTENGGGMNLEEITYESWLKDKLYMDKKNMEGGFRYDTSMGQDDFMALRMRGTRPLRKVSQIRVNPIEMDLPQLELALNKKMIEKMGRRVPVSLVDKMHAKCGICTSVISLNKKFEIVHLVRHFNAWHPSAHRCSGHWPNRPVQPGCGKPLSIQDFAVIDVNMDVPDNLQCIWCGMFMDRNALAMHFTEVHPDEIEVPKCLLCLQELVINARLLEKYGEDYEVTLPDERHFKCQKFAQQFTSEAQLDKAIAKRMQKINASGPADGDVGDDAHEDESAAKSGTVTNSRMNFGRRNKPKRSFVQPSLRQAVPVDSKYVEAVTECHWRCKLCKGNIFGAVISAGAIKHYKQYHPGEMENMQYEVCKTRLDRVSGGCMEFVHPQLVECLICNLTYTLHKPYNMCRGIRHLKLKHPDMMPENSGAAAQKETTPVQKTSNAVRLGEMIEDPEMITRFKSEYHVEFDRVQAVYGENSDEPVYVLLGADETIDRRTAREMIQSLGEGPADPTAKRVVVGPRASMSASAYDEEDPYGELAEEEELAGIEAKPEQTRISRVVTAEDGTEVVEEVVAEDGREYQDEVVVEEEYEEYYHGEEEFIEGEQYEYIEGVEEGEEYHDEPV